MGYNQGPYSYPESGYVIDVTFWILKKSGGSGGRTEADVIQAFCQAKEDFNLIGIDLNLLAIEEIKNTNLYTFPNFCGSTPPTATMISKVNYVKNNLFWYNTNSLNVYVTDISQMHAGYTESIPGKVIFLGGKVPSGCTNDLLLSGVLEHEIGHALGLYHPTRSLLGQAVPGVPIDYADPNSALTPICDQAGDEVCDTYPDIYTYQDCNTPYDNPSLTQILSPFFNGNLVQVGNDKYYKDVFNFTYLSTPGVRNPMSIGWAAATGCQSQFTTGQGDKIKAMFQKPDYFYMNDVLNNWHIGIPLVTEDLYIKDNPQDQGAEPNTTPGITVSSDIWVRNQNDGFLIQAHENPDFSNGDPYVYVRVRNRSCQSSLIQPIRLYWSKAGTTLDWPSNWDGSATFQGTSLPKGGLIGVQQIPILDPWSEIIIEFEWDMDPADLNNYALLFPEYYNTWHYCLLARMNGVGGMNQISFAETVNAGQNVKNNNNIAAKNLTVVRPDQNKVFDVFNGGTIVVNPTTENPSNAGYFLKFSITKGSLHEFNENFIYRIYPNSSMENVFVQDSQYESLKRGEDFYEIESLPATLNLDFTEGGDVNLLANAFLPIAEVYDSASYIVDISQFYIRTDSTGIDTIFIGQEEFKLELSEGILSAEFTVDSAVFLGSALVNGNLSDSLADNYWEIGDSLFLSGESVSFTMNEATKKVILYSTDRITGVVSIDSLTVYAELGEILSLTPNPTSSGNVQVSLELANASLSYQLHVIDNQTGAQVHTQVLNSNQVNLNVGNFGPGQYLVLLTSANNVVDSEILFIQ